jgi:type IV pilus biogenesis protein PilP
MGGIASSIPGTSDGLMKAPETPAAVKDAITRLQKTDNINLDDMIRAQDAINRLDLMLEIEKRQDEIKKLREGDKPKGMSSLLQGGIPASVLGLPSTKTPAFNPSGGDDFASAPVIKRTPKEVDYTVTRIIGSNGRYAAVLDNGDESVTVRSGEKLPDGRKVASINLTSVVISGGEKGSKGKTLTIPSDTYIVRGTSLTD